MHSAHACNDETRRTFGAGRSGHGERSGHPGRFAVAVDFHHVAPQHEEIDARLRNWARWCNGKPESGVTPMFRAYRSTDVWAAPDVSAPIDKLDAARIGKAVIDLPGYHRAATQWHYVKPVAPGKAARQIGVTLQALAQLVQDARTILINRHA